MPRSRTDQELKGALKDLCYVLDQIPAIFFWELMLFPSINPELRNRKEFVPVRNALIDSSLLNIRVLNEFFKEGGAPDDIRASQYIGFHSQGGFLSPQEQTEINKHLAHFTTVRALSLNKGWKIYDLILKAYNHADLFLEYLLSEPANRYKIADFNVQERRDACFYIRDLIKAKVRPT